MNLSQLGDRPYALVVPLSFITNFRCCNCWNLALMWAKKGGKKEKKREAILAFVFYHP